MRVCTAGTYVLLLLLRPGHNTHSHCLWEQQGQQHHQNQGEFN